ncbi:MAG: ABC transporter permease [Ardenticatenia bacterium]|nr:MAG: ABC transporter permease [Ardenticatenia bacterium]
MRDTRLFRVNQPLYRSLGWADVLVLVGIAVLLYVGVRLAVDSPMVLSAPTIDLGLHWLPLYAGLSLARMFAAYILSLIFSLVYGRLAAYNRQAEMVLLPLLDVLQSVPILSFLPAVVLSLSALLPQRLAVELSSVVLIFTSQVWNLTFAWYQSLVTIPKELREVSTCFGINGWLQFSRLELPFGAISLIWNSMMSWAGGWFFLMAAEMFTVGQRNFRLPGLGAYLQEAASRGNLWALGWGIVTLLLLIVALDQLVWRPLLAWSDRFNLQMVSRDNPPSSWFYDVLRNAQLVAWFHQRVLRPVSAAVDGYLSRRFQARGLSATSPTPGYVGRILGGLVIAILAYGALRAGQMLSEVSLTQWGNIALGVGATLLRVLGALAVALAWTLPLGVAMGTNPRLARWLQPLVQVAASVPATALFPAVLLVLLRLPGGLNLAAVVLMLMGTQWYLLFNVIAGASAIPQDLKYTATLLQMDFWRRWRVLVLPAIFPYVITGAITASGGAWNASIVAEHVEFAGETHNVIGIGALIARATAVGDYPLLLAATLAMIVTVVLINRLVWRRLFRIAEQHYRME